MKPRNHLSALAVLVLSLSVGTNFARAEDATEVFAEIEGFPGWSEMTQIGGVEVHEWIRVLSFSDGVSRSFASGRTRSKAQAAEIVITKPVDQSTPLFYQALTTNETIPQATFHFFGPSPFEGTVEEFYKVTLFGLRVSSVKTHYEHGVGLVQEVKFVAERIQWSYFGQGGSSEAEWNTLEAF